MPDIPDTEDVEHIVQSVVSEELGDVERRLRKDIQDAAYASKPMLSLEEAVRYCGGAWCAETLRRKLRSGDLGGAKRGQRWFVNRKSLLRMMGHSE